MACYHPLKAYQEDDGSIVFSQKRGNSIIRELKLPCGRCIGCRLDRSLAWAGRIASEAKLYPQNAFITLTYEDEHLPQNGQLIKQDFQQFMKRLRKRYAGVIPVPGLDDGSKPNSIRYFMCGEYGDENGRPHFHACLLNFQFPDLKRYRKNKQGDWIYTSRRLTQLWGKGICTTANLSVESAAYVARYVTKKITGDLAHEHYKRIDLETGEIYYLEPEFATMSRKIALGIPFLTKYCPDVYNIDKLHINKASGQMLKIKPPRTWDNHLEKMNPDLYKEIRYTREENGMEHYLEYPEEFTEERLLVKEEVLISKYKQLQRPI
jgi:hypothetical protein